MPSQLTKKTPKTWRNKVVSFKHKNCLPLYKLNRMIKQDIFLFVNPRYSSRIDCIHPNSAWTKTRKYLYIQYSMKQNYICKDKLKYISISIIFPSSNMSNKFLFLAMSGKTNWLFIFL